MATEPPNDQDLPEEAGENAVPLGTVIIETYEIQSLINVGGMGEVYRGINMHTKDEVAIKIVLPSLAHDPKISALFQKEAQVLGRLFHDSIVRYHIYTYDKGIGRPCLVMEFVEGESLTEHFDSGPMPEDQVRRLIRRLADGLGQAHQAGTVHRDLTPNNVILPNKSVDQAKIIDFGIAKTTAAGSGTVLQGQFAGTLNFVSPEQLGDFGGEIDGRSDIYSLGLLAAACCRGETLDMGTSVVEAVNARRGVPDISDVYPGLRPILTAMLEPDPKNRPESMAKVVELLDAPAEALNLSQPPAGQQIPSDRTVIAPMPSLPPAQPNVLTAPPAPGAAPTYSTPPSGIGQPGVSSPPGVGAPSAPPPYTPPPAPEPKKKRSKMPLILLLLAAVGGGGYGAYVMELIPGLEPVAPNVVPVAADDSGETEFETALTLDVLANDSDPDGDDLTIISVTNPDDGRVTNNGDSLTYTPDTDFNGLDSFSYTLSDGRGGEASANVEIFVKQGAEDPVTRVNNHIAYLNEQGRATCTYVEIKKSDPDGAEVEMYGVDPSAAGRLAGSFKTARGAELITKYRQITSDQCAALDFVKLIRSQSDDNPGLILDRDVLISGDQIRGTVKGFEGKNIWLFLVDGDGGVYDVSSLVELLGDDLGTFGLQIQLTAGSENAPQLMLMVVTEGPVTTASAVRNGSPARTLLPLVEQEFKTGDLDPSVSIGFFSLEN